MMTTEEMLKDLEARNEQKIKDYQQAIQDTPDSADYHLKRLINQTGFIGWQKGYITGIEIWRPDARWVWEENDVLSVRWLNKEENK